ncbi:hypothetical protein [Umezawaea sp.]|uniref:hypothetical protein n=1 Tax=Umezawaea sp. TaxID=1955258 RepID=UPI002ED216D3
MRERLRKRTTDLPLAVILTPGQAGDDPQPLRLLDEIRDTDVDGQRVRVGG